MAVRNRYLDVLSDPAAVAESRSPSATALLSFDRFTLRQILLSSLAECVHFGPHMVSYQESNDTVSARFADGRVVTADFLSRGSQIGSCHTCGRRFDDGAATHGSAQVSPSVSPLHDSLGIGTYRTRHGCWLQSARPLGPEELDSAPL